MNKYKFKKGDRVEVLRDSDRIRKGDKGTVMENSQMLCVKWDRVVAPNSKGETFMGEPSEFVWPMDKDDIRLITDESNPTVRAALLNAKLAIDDALDMLGGDK